MGLRMSGVRSQEKGGRYFRVRFADRNTRELTNTYACDVFARNARQAKDKANATAQARGYGRRFDLAWTEAV